MLREQQKILESGILADRFRAASPSSEFKLGDPQVGLQVQLAPGIPGAERHVFDPLIWLEDARKAEQDPERMVGHIDLSGQALRRKHGIEDAFQKFLNDRGPARRVEQAALRQGQFAINSILRDWIKGQVAAIKTPC